MKTKLPITRKGIEKNNPKKAKTCLIFLDINHRYRHFFLSLVFFKRHMKEQVETTLTKLARAGINVFQSNVYLLENITSPVLWICNQEEEILEGRRCKVNWRLLNWRGTCHPIQCLISGRIFSKDYINPIGDTTSNCGCYLYERKNHYTTIR